MGNKDFPQPPQKVFLLIAYNGKALVANMIHYINIGF